MVTPMTSLIQMVFMVVAFVFLGATALATNPDDTHGHPKDGRRHGLGGGRQRRLESGMLQGEFEINDSEVASGHKSGYKCGGDKKCLNTSQRRALFDQFWIQSYDENNVRKLNAHPSQYRRDLLNDNGSFTPSCSEFRGFKPYVCPCEETACEPTFSSHDYCVEYLSLGKRFGDEFSLQISDTGSTIDILKGCIGFVEECCHYPRHCCGETCLNKHVLCQLYTNACMGPAPPTTAPVEPPVGSPTEAPVGPPIDAPTFSPIDEPTSISPTTLVPSVSPGPTPEPTPGPTPEPTPAPTPGPTPEPTPEPTGTPSVTPTGTPSASPTGTPSASPTATPSENPTPDMTEEPVMPPTVAPTIVPSVSPSVPPSIGPSMSPSVAPTESQRRKNRHLQRVGTDEKTHYTIDDLYINQDEQGRNLEITCDCSIIWTFGKDLCPRDESCQESDPWDPWDEGPLVTFCNQVAPGCPYCEAFVAQCCSMMPFYSFPYFSD